MPSSTMRCASCGVAIAHVRDTRFGAMPTEALCLACSSPAAFPRVRARPVAASA